MPRARTIVLTLALAGCAALWVTLSRTPELRVNGRTVTPSVPPFVTADDHLFLPIRSLARSVGGSILLDGRRHEIILRRGRTVLRFRLGDRFANLNGRSIELDRAPFIVRGRTMIDAEVASRAFAVHVAYERAKNRVDILTPELNFQRGATPR